VDKDSWNLLVAVVTGLVILASVVALFTAQPRRQVLVPFVPSLLASVVIYLAMVHGASSFHTAFVICSLLALAFAFVLVLYRPAWDRLAMFAWALLGVVTPFTLLIALLVVVCWGHTECLG
jgi:uncharacterized membrane protein